MSVETYNKLASRINERNYGDSPVLPELTEAGLFITCRQVRKGSLAEAVGSNQIAGWQLYTDSIAISPRCTPGKTVLEAEFWDGATTTRIRLLHGDLYLLTRYSLTEGKDSYPDCAFYDQSVLIRRQLRSDSASCARYRFWYREQNGRWEAMAQQFLGFEGEENE